VKRDYPDRPIVGVGAVIIDRDRVVVVRRAGEPALGEWSIPGGVLELGETLRQGAAREALEETGLAVQCLEVVDVVDRILPDGDGRPRYHYVLVDFLCRPLPGALRPGGDASEVRWITRQDLDSLAIVPPGADVIRKAFVMATSNKR